MASGINAETYTKIIPGGAKLFVGSTMYGTTRGAGSFDPGVTMRNVPFDGKVADIAGLDRKVYSLPTMNVTLLEITATKLAALIPGSSTAVVGGVTNVIPGDAQVFLTPLDNVRLIWKLADGTFDSVRLKKARPEMTSWGGGAADDEATVGVTFTGLAVGTTDATMHVSPHMFEMNAPTEAAILANP